MANDDKRRKSFWDDQEEDTGFIQPKKQGSPGQGGSSQKSDKPLDSKDIDRLIQEARTLMEQTHQLYQMYLSGIERRPPVEKAKFLEARIAEIQRQGGNVTTNKFKISQLVALYNTTRELWDRKLKEKEKK
jgi:hypothetical protein